MADGAAATTAEEPNAAETAAGTLRSSWEATTLVACIAEEGQIEGRQRNVGSWGDRNAAGLGDKDAATTGTVCGTGILFADQTHMTSGTPAATTTQEGAVIKIGLDSVRKDDGLNFPLCAPSTLRGSSKFKQFKLLGRPRRVLRNDDSSTGSDESVEVAERNSGDSGTGASGDSIKSDGRKSPNSELPKLLESTTEAESESEKKDSESENVAPQDRNKVSQPQGDSSERPKVRPFNGLEDIKGELQALQLLSKQQRKLGDLPKPPGTVATSRSDPQVAPGPGRPALTGLEQLVSRCTRSDNNIDVKERDKSPTSQQRKISPRRRQDEIRKPPKSPIGCSASQVQSATSLPVTAQEVQEVVRKRDAISPKGEAKICPPRTEEHLAKAVIDEANKQKPADTVSRKARENAHFVIVNSRRYQKLGKIGSGGSSDVFKVIAQDCTIYALKRIILKGRDHQTASGFHQEIEYLERLRDQPHIIQLIDYEVTDKSIFESNRHGDIQTDACIYMVLEYGEIDLARMLERKKRELGEEKRLDENWLRLYWEHILKAVNTIHNERIVHADLKPANFLLVQGVLKLIDFGIAKAIQNDTTNIVRDSQVGTLNYMSPEAFMMSSRDEHGTVKCGRASDIWSLGCILYQMVYGRTPFSHLNFYQKITEITNPRHEIEFPPISNPLILDVIKSCLVWDKSKRPRIPQLLEHPFLKPRVSEDVAGLQFTREALLQSCKVYVSFRGTLELTELMRKVVKGTPSSSATSSSSLEQQYQQLDDALLRLSRLYMQKAGKSALHELLTLVL